MIRLKDTVHKNTSSFLSSAIRVAGYYGFVPFEEAVARAREAYVRVPHGESSRKSMPEIMFARREERPLATVARRCAFCAQNPGTTLLAWRTSGSTSRERSGIPVITMELHIIGAA